MIPALLVASAALAQPCPDVSDRVDEAWRLYNDAELEQAKAVVVEAYDGLACQTRVVSTETLLALYRLDGLVSLTGEDPKGAIYATLRAVAAAHEGAAPPPEYGPELAELYATWSSRLGSTLITITVDGGGTVWVDGRTADAASPLTVAEGEHLVQVDDGSQVASTIMDISVDSVVTTGVPLPDPVVPPVPDPDLPMPAPEPVPLPDPITELDPDPDPVPRLGRRRPAWIWGPAILTAAGAGFALSSGSASEASFQADSYEPRFVDCDYADPCYPVQREALVRYNARIINTAYGVGYGLAGVTAGLLTVTAVGLPRKR